MIDNSPIVPVEHNLAEYSVSEIAQAIKRTLEGAFERVRIRGEVSRPNYHSSGHLYFTMKDEGAVLDAVCWRGTVGQLKLRVEEGMEVICTGRVSSYARSSRYQLVVESVELAGEGALLKLLEDRRRKLAAEGLFDQDRKKPLPFLPEVVGVVTSPTGAVIRDILHRLNDRFPRHVLLWPVPVQGEGAAEKIAAAIAGFNALERGGAVPRPDVLIVGRGGGSLEDLWAFNEEVVVRTAAASSIPLISAVGHETDTTLIDFAADRRAPTPTAAAEIAVPVRTELHTEVIDKGRRLTGAAGRMTTERQHRLEGLARGLPHPRRLLEEAYQRLDNETDRLSNAMRHIRSARRSQVETLAARLRHPKALLDLASERTNTLGDRLKDGTRTRLAAIERGYVSSCFSERLHSGVARTVRDAEARLRSLEGLLDSLSYEGVLERGYAVVRDADGVPVTRKAGVTPGADIEVEFADGRVGARVHDDGAPSRPRKRTGKKPDVKEIQGKLL